MTKKALALVALVLATFGAISANSYADNLSRRSTLVGEIYSPVNPTIPSE